METERDSPIRTSLKSGGKGSSEESTEGKVHCPPNLAVNWVLTEHRQNSSQHPASLDMYKGVGVVGRTYWRESGRIPGANVCALELWYRSPSHSSRFFLRMLYKAHLVSAPSCSSTLGIRAQSHSTDETKITET